MAQLRQNYENFLAEDTIIVVVGPEDKSAFTKYFEKNQLPFLGLPDPKNSVLKLYGQQIKLFKFGRMPAQLLIDKDGIVKFVHYGHDMTDIPRPREMLDLLASINKV